MRNLLLTIAIIIFALSPKSFSQQEIGWEASGAKGACAAGGAPSVAASMEILKAGGNAFDSAAAMLLALTVTDYSNYCFGGEVPIIIYDAKRQVTEVLAVQGVTPRLATLEHFLNRDDKVIPKSGPEPASVPAVVDGVVTLLERYGTMTFAQVAQPTLNILANPPARRSRRGGQSGPLKWHQDLTRTLNRLIDAEKAAGGDRRTGVLAVSDYFYRGPIAREIDQWSRENGGLIRYTDMATHFTRIEAPVTIDYRGYTVAKCNTWTQGPSLLQMLNLLEGYDLKAMGHNSSDYIHVVTEAMKLSFADRDEYYADPHFEEVPLDALLSKEYTDMRRKLIDMKKASDTLQPGDPVNMRPLLQKSTQGSFSTPAPAFDTTTGITADRWGNVVATTPSGWNRGSEAAQALAGDTGVWLNSRLISLNTWPGHVNAIEPGKRPRITLTPSIVLKDGKPAYAVSICGGDSQDQVSLQLLLNSIEFGMDPAEAVIAPMFNTDHLVGSFSQTEPKLASLNVKREISDETIKDLEARGHIVKRTGYVATPSMMSFDPKTGLIKAAGDPKTGRFSDAWK